MAVPGIFVDTSAGLPFGGGPQVNHLVPFASWRRARDRACAALLAGERVLLVTGPSGTGKTMLIHEIARVLRFTGWDVSTSVSELPPATGRAGSAPSVLLVDEADRLSEAELRTLCSSTRSSVLLAGMDSLAERCPGSPRISLAPLSPAEAKLYIEQWLTQAGFDGSRLEVAAVLRIIELSTGLPRLLGALLGGSIWLAGSAPVTPQKVDEAASLRDCLLNDASGEAADDEAEYGASPDAPSRWRRLRTVAVGGAVLGIAVCAGVAAGHYWPVPAEWRDFVAAHLPRAALPAATPEVATAVAHTVAPPPAEAQPGPVEPARFTEPPTRPPEPPAEEPEPVLAAPAAPVPPPAIPASVPPAAAPADAQKAQSPAPEPVPASVPAAPSQDALSPALVEILVRRGNEMFALGDYSAARLLFGRAAAAGNPAAMLAMGRTYDPAFLDGTGGPGATDPAAAAQWYRSALTAGNTEAGGLLQRVQRQVAK